MFNVFVISNLLMLYSIIVLLFLLILLELFFVLRRRRLSARDMKFIRREWDVISGKFKTDPRHAVLEADKLLDFVLKRRGFSGSMGDKLRKAGDFFGKTDAVWAAHKLRNRIAHEVGFEITTEEARRAHASFKQALFDLGVK